jgi:hypothetical protein
MSLGPASGHPLLPLPHVFFHGSIVSHCGLGVLRLHGEESNQADPGALTSAQLPRGGTGHYFRRMDLNATCQDVKGIKG